MTPPDLPLESYYDGIAAQYDILHNEYDVSRRVEILFDRTHLGPVEGALLLDGGAGTGWFSRQASSLGARVVALDIAPRMLQETRRRCACAVVCGSLEALPFRRGVFAVVVSSEAIEHTPSPSRSIAELCRVLMPEGRLALSTPNLTWYPALVAARLLGLRAFHGIENWLSWWSLRRILRQTAMTLTAQTGIHILPFQWKRLHPFLTFMDRFGAILGPLYVNQAVWARKSPRR